MLTNNKFLLPCNLITLLTDPWKILYTIFNNVDNWKGNRLESILSLSVSMKKNDKENIQNLFIAANMAILLRNYTYMQGNNNVLGLAKLLFRLFYILDVYEFSVSINSIYFYF